MVRASNVLALKRSLNGVAAKAVHGGLGLVRGHASDVDPSEW